MVYIIITFLELQVLFKNIIINEIWYYNYVFTLRVGVSAWYTVNTLVI